MFQKISNYVSENSELCSLIFAFKHASDCSHLTLVPLSIWPPCAFSAELILAFQNLTVPCKLYIDYNWKNKEIKQHSNIITAIIAQDPVVSVNRDQERHLRKREREATNYSAFLLKRSTLPGCFSDIKASWSGTAVTIKTVTLLYLYYLLPPSILKNVYRGTGSSRTLPRGEKNYVKRLRWRS